MNSRLLQNHIVRTTGKLVQLKDLHNIKAVKTADGLNDWQSTLKHLDTLRTNDPGATIEVLTRQEDVGLEMIILQTSAMKSALAAFPEVIQMDGTYATNKAGLPLYGLVAEDAHGRGKLVAVVLTRGESALNIETMLERLKSHNTSLEKTQVFIVDKDFAEIQAIMKVLPQVQVQLCIFHVLKAMRKEVLKLVGRESQRDVFAVIHSLVYARSAESFEERWAQLQEYAEFHNYMNTSWLPIRKQWALFERTGYVTLGNTTNNRIECQFGKLKHIITSRRRLSECIRLILSVLTSSDVISMQHQYADRCKIRYHNSYTGVGAEYFSLVTDYACRKILKQISVAATNKYSVDEISSDDDRNGNTYKVTNIKTSETYTVTHSCQKCTCSFSTGMLLPCRHVFAARHTAGLSPYDSSLVADRWLLTTHSTSVDARGGGIPEKTSMLIGSMSCSSARTLNQRKKYNKAVKLTNKLAVIMSESGQYEFDVQYSFLSSVLERFENGRDCILVEEDEEGYQQPDDQNLNADGEQDVAVTNDNGSEGEATGEATVTADALEDAMVVNYLDSITTDTSMNTRSQGWEDVIQVTVLAQAPKHTAATNCTGEYVQDELTLVSTAGAPVHTSDDELSAAESRDTIMPSAELNFRTVSPSSLTNVTVPVARRCRGRPKGTDKSLNVKYGLAQSQRKRRSKCETTRKPRSARTKTTIQSSQGSTEENCAECGLLEPRKKAKGVSMVNWIQCDKCHFWYHECCIAAMPGSYDDEYVCARCE